MRVSLATVGLETTSPGIFDLKRLSHLPISGMGNPSSCCASNESTLHFSRNDSIPDSSRFVLTVSLKANYLPRHLRFPYCRWQLL